MPEREIKIKFIELIRLSLLSDTNLSKWTLKYAIARCVENTQKMKKTDVCKEEKFHRFEPLFDELFDPVGVAVCDEDEDV